MSKFEKCIKYILDAEGGLVDDPKDSGGITKYGVSLRAYKNAYPEATKDTIRNLTVEQAKQFYETFYWIESGAEHLPLPVALLVFDTAVNCGTIVPKRMLQRVLKVTADGVIGPKTLAALNKMDVNDIICGFTAERIMYYDGLCTSTESDTAQKKQIKLIRRARYLRGWINRTTKMQLNAILIGK
ncbi:MAG: hypothetical protein NC124_02210 [Clostridium sp.]|nr:hypothetical protein [Clostridium sp.]